MILTTGLLPARRLRSVSLDPVGEEGRAALTLGMLIAQRTLAHISKLYSSLGAGIHKPVTAEGMELGCGDNLCQFFHVGWLDINNVKTLILYVEVPEVDTQIIAADECLPIAVDRDAINVICVRIGVCAARHSSDNSVVVSEAWELEVRRVLELHGWKWSSCTTPSSNIARRDIVREVVFGNHLQRLLENLPQFDCLIVGGKQVM